ncbi:hypothetical protein [Caulobacter soli]|uniref:hypothetical protein n=1 Tax=Caulobacter soli TaxID=2708539 RepID=UPI0013E9DD52|nr:hypothetical protein [Caulobacter soli]
MIRQALAGLVLLALTAPAVASAQAPALSKMQARALPPAELTQRVMDQVADLLIPAPQPSSGRKPLRPLRDLDFATAPRATYVPGVCARDEVIVTFAPVGDTAQGPDTPVRASSLSAHSRYRLLGPPAREIDNYGAPPPASAQQDCGRLVQDPAPFFSAPTAEVALSGAWWLTRLAAAPNQAPIDCKPAGAEPLACADILGDLTLDDLKAVEPCFDDHRGPAPLNCWALSVWPQSGPYALRILTTRGQAPVIARVEMVEETYAADAVAD